MNVNARQTPSPSAFTGGRCVWRVCVWVGLLISVAQSTANAQTIPASIPLRSVTLLVHGMKLNLDAPNEVWGRRDGTPLGGSHWSGMIGRLETAGHRFGGVVRPRGSRLSLPDCLESTTLSFDPSAANVFALEFSSGANADGLAYKTLELASCLAELRRFTGCQRVNIVAHSAGGLVARAYVQGALPYVPYAHDVDRIVTIATPHLGSVLAGNLGDFLGTRATALDPAGELIRRLNEELPLPADVLFASLVVRGVNIGITGLNLPGTQYQQQVDPVLLAKLPVNFRLGGDQVTHVQSQNLRLVPAASQYEATTGKPVLALLVRTPDPTPQDRSFLETTAHEAAPSSNEVGDLVASLLDAGSSPWLPAGQARLSQQLALQARQTAFGIVEQAAGDKHCFSVVQDVRIDAIDLVGKAGEGWVFEFSGRAMFPSRAFGFGSKATRVAGRMNLMFDQFGRLNGEEHKINRVADE